MLKRGDAVMSGAQAVAMMTSVDPRKTESKRLEADLLALSIQASAQLDTAAATLKQMRSIIDGMCRDTEGNKPLKGR
jgi:hypothetical protein